MRWDRGLTPDEMVTKKDIFIVIGGFNQNPVMNMLNIFQRTTKEMRGRKLLKMGMR